MSESLITVLVQLPLPAHVCSSTRNDRRPPAGPLPSKQGEIGFVEGIHNDKNHDEAIVEDLPLRHPADRDYSSTPQSSCPDADVDNSSQNTDDRSNKSPFRCLRRKKVLQSFGGFQLTTLLLFAIQSSVFAATIIAWVFAIKLLKRNRVVGSNTVIAHVLFALAVLGQLVFLERRVYHLRRERYSYLHPGDSMSLHRHSTLSADIIISSAPWNRPPLPTYAAVLAQSGVGTGDVEDNLIVIAPPPTYGNTRGSTLLSISVDDHTMR